MSNDHSPWTLPPGSGFGKNRIEALADGIFAVAMTLLVLDVKLAAGEIYTTDGALWARLVELEHTFGIYFVSFVVLGMFWIGHHTQFHYVRYVDHRILWLNLIFLFVITSVPFSTDLLGDFHHLRVPYLLYSGEIVVLASLLLLQVVYLRGHPHLAESDLTPEVARHIIMRTGAFGALPLISMVFAYFDSRLAIYCYLLMAIVHFLPGRIDQYVLARRSDQ